MFSQYTHLERWIPIVCHRIIYLKHLFKLLRFISNERNAQEHLEIMPLESV
jgi:hypothetical protein